jgi:uncharacterized protein YuzE
VLVRDDLMRHVDRGTAEVDRTYRSTMRVTLDADTNMAYIHLVEPGEAGAVRHTEPLIIDLDFDAFGMLTGIELFDARAILDPGLLTGDR